MANALFARKSISQLQGESEGGHGLHRTLSRLDLVMLGIGAVIGAGIFVITGHAAAANAGPAVALSFVFAGIASGTAGICYAEMASMIPVAGSAYAYSYATMGEMVAWIIGWDLILEYLVGASTVAVGWSGYFTSFLKHMFHVELPTAFTQAPLTWNETTHAIQMTGSIVNLPAVLIALIVTVVLTIGIRESARFNSIIVFVKLAVLLMFIVLAVPYINPENWKPFIPENAGSFGKFGWSGVFQGATMVFFAYLGFDAVSTAAQECKDPQKDLPFGILGSLGVCTVLYIAVSLILTGVVHYTKLSVPHPIALGMEATGNTWGESIVLTGALAGLSSVILVMLMGQSRIFYAMSADGLLPKVGAAIHPRFKTPYVATIVAGIGAAFISGLLPIEILGELTSIGTLFAFVLVSLGVLILRKRHPELPRKFKAPGGDWLIPGLGMLTSGILMYTATTGTLIRLFVWMALGMAIFYGYSRKHSKLTGAKAAR